MADSDFPKPAGRLPILFGLALLAVIAIAAYFYSQQGVDKRFARRPIQASAHADLAGSDVATLARGQEVKVMRIDASPKGDIAEVLLVDGSTAYVFARLVDKDRRPVIVGGRQVKVLRRAIDVQDEPNTLGQAQLKLDKGTEVEIWGITETTTGKWAEITLYKQPEAYYLPLSTLVEATK